MAGLTANPTRGLFDLNDILKRYERYNLKINGTDFREAPYTLHELIKMRYLGPTELREVHRAKLTYPGARFLQYM
jgi:hypothetical protein